MSRPGLVPRRCVVWFLGALLLAGLTLPASADFVVSKSTSSDRLTLRNLVGEIVIEGHSGRDFEIEVSVQGRDADADRIEIELLEGSDATLNILFPLDESSSFVYPRIGRSTTKFSLERDGNMNWMSKLFGGSKKKITVSGRGSGLEIWADVTVRVPAGASLRLEHGLGKVSATKIDGNLDLDSMSGSVEVTRLAGNLGIDVGSGAVTVEHVEGNEILIDTGSGSVDLADCQCKKINIDTGSGHVEAREIDVESAEIDTGSGGVQLELTNMGTGRFEIDTGSGGIELRLPADASAEIRADTGSGRIHIDVDGATVRHKDDDSAWIVVGGGAADVNLDTGSGSIRIRS